MKISAEQLRQELESGKRLALIDVRTPVEHDEMRIRGARLMPVDELDAGQATALVASHDGGVLICQSGKRAERAKEKLSAAGCENVTILEGGVAAWQAAGFPLDRSEKKRLPLMRQVQLIVGLACLTGALLALFVNVKFAIIPAFFGAGLSMAGATGWCGLAILLSKMPWNKVDGCGCKVTSCSVE